MSKEGNYEPLCRYLSGPSFYGRFVLTFDEIESILDTPLPRDARANRGWWSNSKGSWQASAWRNADCRVVTVDLIRERVTFYKPEDYRLPGAGGWNRFRIRSLRRHMRLTQAAFAQAVGVAQQRVSDWETGSRVTWYAENQRLTVLAKRTKFLRPDS